MKRLVLAAWLIGSLAQADPLAPASGDENLETKESGCRNGIGLLCVMVGRAYEKDGDLKAAAGWYEIGCDKADDVLSCAARATLAGQGSTDRWQKKACGDIGPTKGCLALGAALRQRGKLKEAGAWYEKACRRGGSAGCIARGEMADDQGQRRVALKWFNEACRISEQLCEHRDLMKEKYVREIRASKKRAAMMSAKPGPGPKDDGFSLEDLMPRTAEDVAIAAGTLLIVAFLMFKFARDR